MTPRSNENVMKTTLQLLEEVSRICTTDEWSLEFYEGKTISVTEKDIKGYLKSN